MTYLDIPCGHNSHHINSLQRLKVIGIRVLIPLSVLAKKNCPSNHTAKLRRSSYSNKTSLHSNYMQILSDNIGLYTGRIFRWNFKRLLRKLQKILGDYISPHPVHNKQWLH